MAQDAVARRYAEALFELGVEHDKLETFLDQIDGLVETFHNSQVFRHLLLNPGIDQDERREAIRHIGGKLDLDQMLINFLFLLLDNDRVRKLPGIEEAFRHHVDRARNRVRATVTSAVPLEGSEKRALQEVLGEMTGKEIVLSTEVDESLIGGAVARVGSTIYDGSVRNQLEQLKDNILQEV